MQSSSSPRPVARIIALPTKEQSVAPTEYVLKTDQCRIGRSAGCQIVVQDDRKLVSRLHAEIEYQDMRYVLYDKSMNGIFVNGQRIHGSHYLEDKDLIGLGIAEASLQFRDPESTTPARTRLRYDERTMTFFIEQQPLELPPAQFRLLSYLYQHAHTVCTRESCAEAIWGREYDPALDTKALDQASPNCETSSATPTPPLLNFCARTEVKAIFCFLEGG
jgi:hypothetical protein